MPIPKLSHLIISTALSLAPGGLVEKSIPENTERVERILSEPEKSPESGASIDSTVNYLNNRLKESQSLRSNSLVVESREILDMKSFSTVDDIARQAREYLNTKYTFPKEKYGILQYTPTTYEGTIDSITRKKAQGIRDKYPHPKMPHDFSEMTRSHGGSIIAAYAHIEDQMRQYRNNYKNAYEWLMRVDPKYAIIILATGYNSSNSGRARELENIVVNNPSLQPAEIMERFYKGLGNSGAEETRGYIIKIEYILDKGLI